MPMLMRPDITMVNISAVSRSVYRLLIPLGDVTNSGLSSQL